ncbi:MAG: ribosome-associated translation inhibitor RaiA [Candidatus Zixiibacteriota bacterium]
MQIRTTARHFDMTKDLKNFSQKEIKKLKKYYNNIIDCHLILDQEKNRITAELKVKVYGTILSSKYRSYDLSDSVEKVVGKMETQLKKYKAKLQDKKPKEGQAVKSQIENKDPESEQEEQIL